MAISANRRTSAFEICAEARDIGDAAVVSEVSGLRRDRDHPPNRRDELFGIELCRRGGRHRERTTFARELGVAESERIAGEDVPPSAPP
jgi:hypothetical protein